jgi:hypothetical protein
MNEMHAARHQVRIGDPRSTIAAANELNLLTGAILRALGGCGAGHLEVLAQACAVIRRVRRAAHKLNLELDTSFSMFQWLLEGRWLRGVEVKGSLDYVTTGLPKAGDRVNSVPNPALCRSFLSLPRRSSGQ